METKLADGEPRVEMYLVDAVNDLNNALVQDVLDVYARLPTQHQGFFERQLERLADQWRASSRGR